MDNYAGEPQMLRHVHEANIGLWLHKKNGLRLDAGIFSSIIGFESAISIDNWTLTRSLIAENSPYYLTGVKLTYLPNHTWEVVGMVCNGWQRIKMVPGNSLPSLCTQVKFTPSEKVCLNWSSFTGTDAPDTTRRMRYFHNFYGQFQFSPRLGLIAGIDLGSEQINKGSHKYGSWVGAAVMARYELCNHWATALRAEYYHDPRGIIIAPSAIGGFKASGISANVDYKVNGDFYCRLEARWLGSDDRIFQQQGRMVGNNFFIVSSMALRFDK
jgi:hypothetical protein